jgi:hypothetical protein
VTEYPSVVKFKAENFGLTRRLQRIERIKFLQTEFIETLTEIYCEGTPKAWETLDAMLGQAESDARSRCVDLTSSLGKLLLLEIESDSDPP